jgi:TfoX/Sxy family transcriptional regulator of competence genes
MEEAVAEPYLKRLSSITGRLDLNRIQGVNLEPRHFFSGAALYANGKICASLSPAGFALKLPAEMRQRLIAEGKGTEFRFFAGGPVKREYINLSESIIQDEAALQELILAGINYVLDRPGSDAG